jgi:putative nucleotidyltransferase with HDIG domain
LRETAALVQNGSISDRIADALLRLDFFTFFHSCRVEKLAATIGRHLSLTSKEIMILKQGALLHDIGKLEVPSEILNKQDPLTPQEIALIQEHPIHGYDFARSIEMNDSVLHSIIHPAYDLLDHLNNIRVVFFTSIGFKIFNTLCYT